MGIDILVLFGHDACHALMLTFTRGSNSYMVKTMGIFPERLDGRGEGGRDVSQRVFLDKFASHVVSQSKKISESL